MKIYQTIDELLKDLHVTRPSIDPGFHVFSFRETANIEKDALDPHQKNFFTIDLYLENKSERQIGFTEIKDISNSIAFNSPNQLFSVQQFEGRPGIDGYSLVFSPQFFNNKHQYEIQQEFPYFKLNSIPFYRLEGDQRAIIISIFQTLYSEQDHGDILHVELVRAYLKVLLLHIKRFVGSATDMVHLKRYQEITASFEELILIESMKIRTISEYANRLNITPIYLSECVKKATGLSAKKVLSNYMMLRSKGLLLQTTQSIEEIAYEMGFDEATNFIKFFKSKEGVTPAVFRKVP